MQTDAFITDYTWSPKRAGSVALFDLEVTIDGWFTPDDGVEIEAVRLEGEDLLRIKPVCPLTRALRAMGEAIADEASQSEWLEEEVAGETGYVWQGRGGNDPDSGYRRAAQ